MKKIRNFFTNNYIFNFKALKFWNTFISTLFILIGIIFVIITSVILSLNNIVDPFNNTENEIIIEIYPESTKERTEYKKNLVLDYLKQQNIIQNINVLTNNEIIEIINSFSGEFKDFDTDIDLPVIITLSLNNNTTKEDINTLRLNLSQKANNVYLDEKEELLKRLVSPINTAKNSVFIVALIIITLMCIVLFFSIYSVIFANKEIFLTLILLGSTNTKLALDFSVWIIKKSVFANAVILSFAILLALLFKFNNIDIAISNYFYMILSILVISPCVSWFLSIIFAYKIINNFNK